MDKVSVTLPFARETKAFVCHKDTEHQAVQDIYIRKEALKGTEFPKAVVVTVEPA